jgi:hypothetical protein
MTLYRGKIISLYRNDLSELHRNKLPRLTFSSKNAPFPVSVILRDKGVIDKIENEEGRYMLPLVVERVLSDIIWADLMIYPDIMFESGAVPICAPVEAPRKKLYKMKELVFDEYGRVEEGRTLYSYRARHLIRYGIPVIKDRKHYYVVRISDPSEPYFGFVVTSLYLGKDEERNTYESNKDFLINLAKDDSECWWEVLGFKSPEKQSFEGSVQNI